LRFSSAMIHPHDVGVRQHGERTLELATPSMT
jgi:hypothetical protein